MADAAPAELGALLRHVRARLQAAGKPDAALDARLIVEHASGTTRSDAVLEPDRLLKDHQVEAALAMLERRLAGEPVHRIIGARDFYGMTLRLSPETLEPRPDTEALVDLALPLVRTMADRHGICRILDMGTGTGAIVLAMLKEEPRTYALASDISAGALATAVTNAEMIGIGGRLATRVSHWFDVIDERFHVIVSNPPYIPSRDIASLEREVREHDPLAALDGGADGLDAYREIAAGAAGHLEEEGYIALEIGHDQADAVTAIFANQGFRLEAQAQDLGGIVRALVFTVGTS